MMLFGASEKKF